MTARMPAGFLAFLIAVAGLAAAARAPAQELLPRPPELEPDIAFWVRIFAEVDSDSGLLHDNRHLGVVYGEIRVPANLADRTRQRQVDAERDKIRAALQTLAGGKREALSPTEQAVLDAWGATTGNAEFRAAVERIRFQRGLADRFRAGLQRSGRWRPFIESEFAALGVPLELAALPHVESSYNPAARSHVGASGIWQFTRSTGRRFLRIDHILDERNDPFTASRAAGQLLAYNHSITGNWPTAITAYNHGLGGVRRAMREYGDTAYVDILRKYDGRTFGFASRNFYVAFLAAVDVDRNAEQWFPGLRKDDPEDYELLRLSNYLSAPALAGALGIELEELARHNGALQPTIWQGSKLVPRDYELRIPARLLAAPADQLLAAVPASEWAPEQLPDLFHTIARGDTLSQIADHYGTSVSTLVALNDLGSQHRIRAGQQLRLPAAGPAPASVREPAEAEVVAAVEGEVVAAVEAEVAAAVEAEVEAAVDAEPAPDAALAEASPAALTGEATGDEAEAGGGQTELLSDPSDYSVRDDGTVEVQPLETLGHYADWLGIRTQRLRDANGFEFGTPVAVGQRIRLAFAEVDAAAFESRRVAYHRTQQDQYFAAHTITGVREHTIERGESVWVLALREYGVPLWLFRQYNPEFDLHRVRPGMRVRFPVLVERAPE